MLKRFDDAVGRTANHSQSVAQLISRLMMVTRTRWGGGSHDARDAAVGGQRYNVVVLTVSHARPAVGFNTVEIRNVLMHGSAERNIDDLQPSTDREQWRSRRIRRMHARKFEVINDRVGAVDLRMGDRAIAARFDVGTAGQDETVDAVDDRNDVVPRIASRVEQYGNATCGAHSVEVLVAFAHSRARPAAHAVVGESTGCESDDGFHHWSKFLRRSQSVT